jgi:iron-sulfur cluster assembly 1
MFYLADKLDEEVTQDGVKIYIDKKAQLSLLGNVHIKYTNTETFLKQLTNLLGTEMDFVESKLASEFVFNNPNIKGTCGCGESFSL